MSSSLKDKMAENLRKEAISEEWMVHNDGETPAQRNQRLEQRQLALKVSCNAYEFAKWENE